MSTIFGFSIIFGCLANIVDCFTNFCFCSSDKIDTILWFYKYQIFFKQIWLRMIEYLLCDVFLNKNCFLVNPI